MKKAAYLLTLTLFFFLNSFGQGTIYNVGKRKAMKKANQAIPKAAEWTAKVDGFIASKNCDSLVYLKWEYYYYDVSYNTKPVTPVSYPEVFGGSTEKFKTYYTKVAIALAECKQWDFILGSYKDSAKANQLVYSPFDDMTKELREYWLKKYTKSPDKEIIESLNNPQLTDEQKSKFSLNIMSNIFDKNLFQNPTIILDALMPYYDKNLSKIDNDYDSNRRMWIYNWGQLKYTPAIPQIKAALLAKNSKIRYAAVFALGELNVKSALSKLEIIAKNDPIYYLDDYGNKIYDIRDAANEAIQKIKLAED